MSSPYLDRPLRSEFEARLDQFERAARNGSPDLAMIRNELVRLATGETIGAVVADLWRDERLADRMVQP